ncbi:MAG: hypothetical protein IJZ07_04375 [Clostridia bacterium]|nr:hypothetical protein [Clostridia bacterium]
MSDYLNNNSGDSELDAILAEVRKSKDAQSEPLSEEPSKTWSLDDIDRLIAGANGEEYVPKPKKEPTPDEDFERILSREFDTGIFTVKPLAQDKPEKKEMQDISSMSSDSEMDGQEKFFEAEEIDDFDESLFEIETVIVPEDIPAPPAPMFAWQETEKKEEKKEEKKSSEIKTFYEGEIPASEFFGQPEEKQEHITENDYKTRFFSKLVLEHTAEIELPEEEGPVDRSGIVIEKTGAETESGLEAMPRVHAAEDIKEVVDEKTRIMEKVGSSDKKEEQAGDDVEGQIVLTGFDDDDEELPEQDTDTDVEESLWEKRKQKAKNFRLVNAIDLDSDFEGDFEAPPEERAKEEKARRKKEKRMELEQEEARPVANEYSSPAERAAIHTSLSEKSKKAGMSLLLVGAVELIAVLLNIIPFLAEKLSIETELFVAGSVPMNVINAVLIIAAAAIDSVKFFDGITGILKRRITSDTAISLALVVALLQCTLAAVIGSEGPQTAVFSAAAIAAVLIGKIADKMDAQRILGNFEVCAYKYEHNMYAVHPIENESEIFELGRGLMMGNAELLYSSKLSFPSDFIKNSNADSGEKKLMKILIPAAFAAAAIVAITAGITAKSVMTAFSAFTGTFCVCAPVFSAFIPAFIMRITNASLNSEGTMIVSLDAAEKTACANAVVMDSADIFDRSRCTMHGMKDFKNIRIDDVLLYAAAMVIKSGGPMRESFEQVVDGRQDLLPPVKELVYEDKLGISARIHGQKVLLGNRNMLVHHNIEVPEKSLEERYSHSGRKVIYLAVAEKIAALFVVSYAVDKNLTGYFKALENNGIQVLVRTNDVNVTEELISKSFGMPQENFKILSSVAGRLFKRRREAVCDRLPSAIVHDGTAYSMLKSVAAACSIGSGIKLGSIIQIILSVLGFALCMALYCTSAGAVLNGITAALFIGAGLAISAGAMFFGKIK